MNLRRRTLAWLLGALCLSWANPGQAQNEVLAEHIEDYSSSPSSDLPGCADTTSRLVNEFDAAGWDRRWFADANAWESDWMSNALPNGNDDAFSDDADFAYFCGHGNIGLLEFTTTNPGTIFTTVEGQWGDLDAEWVTFDSSLTLRHGGGNLDSWYANGFAKLHLLIGWHDSPLDGDTGGEFADRLIQRAFPDGGGDDLTTAWFANSGGCTDQNSGTTQKILAETGAQFSDHIWGEGSQAGDSSNNGLYFISTNDC
jgi:hypothetical protein